MPTGYTADVATGKVSDLRTFALQCARGLGALIMMRDDPANAPIPECFEPSRYNADRLAECEARLAELDVMQPDDLTVAARADFENRHAGWVRSRASKDEQRNRYNDMIAKVCAWETEADGIKDFMLQQLRSSLDFDCRVSPDEDKWWPEPVPLSGAEWWRVEAEKAMKDIAYHRKAYAEEVARTEDRNTWLAKLFASLPE